MGDGPLGQTLRCLRRAARLPAADTDADLLGRFVARRDEESFAELVRRHGPMVLGVCRRVLRNDADAEDAFQATFLVLARRAGSVGRAGRLGNWLFGVARRTALAARRMARRRRAAEAKAEPRTIAAPVEPDDPIPDLDRELTALPDRYRAVLLLVDLGGRSRAAAAAELGLPEGTVASRLSRARALLAGRLVRRGVTLPAVLAAAVPAGLTAATARVGVLYAHCWAGGPVRPPAALVAERVVRAMWWDRAKWLLAGALVIGLAAGGLTRPPGTAATAAEPTAAARAPAGAPSDDALRDGLLALERKVWDATKKKDWDALKEVVADDFVAITRDGRMTAEELLQDLEGIEIKSYAIGEVKLIRLAEAAALLSYRVKVRYKADGIDGSETAWITSSWVRRGDKWVNKTYQESPVE
jgi:RNA polymerase sigma factor (sigma-70 family)